MWSPLWGCDYRGYQRTGGRGNRSRAGGCHDGSPGCCDHGWWGDCIGGCHNGASCGGWRYQQWN